MPHQVIGGARAGIAQDLLGLRRIAATGAHRAHQRRGLALVDGMLRQRGERSPGRQVQCAGRETIAKRARSDATVCRIAFGPTTPAAGAPMGCSERSRYTVRENAPVACCPGKYASSAVQTLRRK